VFFRSFRTNVVYPPSGYVIALPAAQSAAEGQVARLIRDGFVDNRTRAVFVNFNVYNPSGDTWVVLQFVRALVSAF
jgi:hypothetical protein